MQEAKGFSRQKGYLERYRGSEYSMAFLPKVEISVWVSEARVQEVADKITKAARTGRIGDGKILIVDVELAGGDGVLMVSVRSRAGSVQHVALPPLRR